MLAFALGGFFPDLAAADELDDRYTGLWRPNAFLCEATPGGVRFPSRPTGEAAQPCDDGDMTLFNGLLCAVGEPLGCLGVKEALDRNSGQWYRSPRIRLNGNDRGGASFSPDMAMGVQLYLLKTKDIDSALRWLMWLHDHVPCWVELGGACLVRAPVPRFCTDPPKPGDKQNFECTVRPGDAAALSATVSWLQEKAGMQPLPSGSLRAYLGSWSGKTAGFVKLGAECNRVGFSQHLVAVGILLERMMGSTHPDLEVAAKLLVSGEERSCATFKTMGDPNNAFFRWLAEGSTQAVKDQVLARCPAPDRLPTPPLHQWQWEREDADKAWEHSSYWDCVFMYRLLKPS
ncbi:hypothetical protein [Paucibacter sp. Y2R2-4]|uniref:hypothetical protein n=1 Tax=Paucibacter sp. Y2R2-4 TaxID=2893553 RepID=UPI0021E3C820|nr:hypothetical protein [Paucibacter sp. Y2R2-4]MCV2350815.1 hypothetical protein [Paucibacter sp. Y2R2-4]